ncbi:CynX/NimT family MFS transporter [Sphingomonas sp. NCPPB 2930]
MAQSSSLTAGRTAGDAQLQTRGLGWVLTAGMALPMLMLYAVGALGPLMTRDLGVTPGSLGWVTFSAFGVAACLSPWAGPVTDRLGARRGLVLLFAAVAMAHASMYWAPSLGMLATSVAVIGVAQALCNPVTNLLIARQVAHAHKARMVGLKQSGVQVAALIAGLALPSIASHWGWRCALGAAAPLGLLLAVASCRVAGPKQPGPVRPMSPKKPNARLACLMAIQFGVGGALAAFVALLPAHAVALGLEFAQAGGLIAVFAAAGIVSRIVLTPLAARLRDESPLTGALLLIAAFAIGIVLTATRESHWPLWMGALLMGASAAATNAVAMGMLVRDEGFGGLAVASGWLSAAFFAGLAIGSPLAGSVASAHGGFAPAWMGLAGVLGACAAITLPLSRARRRASA